jgi:hypothetical protein
MSNAQNSADNSAKPPRGNSAKIKPFRWPKGVSGVSELPARVRKKFKDCDDLSLAAAGATWVRA